MQESEPLLASGFVALEPAAGFGASVVELRREREVAGLGEALDHAADVGVYPEQFVGDDHSDRGGPNGRARLVRGHRGAVRDLDSNCFRGGRHS